MSTTLPSCARYVSAFARISSGVSGLRVSERPVGSPIMPVKSPMMTIDLMAEVLEVAQLSADHRVAQMKIGRGGIEPQLDLQRRASLARALELLRELRLDDDVGGAASDDPELLVDRRELQTAHGTGVLSHRF